MPISGLVIKLAPDADRRAVAGALAAVPHLTLGRLDGPDAGPGVPAVLDTPDAATDKAAWDRVRRTPGVLHVDVVFIHFDDDADDHRPASGRNHRQHRPSTAVVETH